MRALDRFNPISVFIYFMAVAGIAMFSMHPVIEALSLMGALVLFFTRREGTMRGQLFYFALFLVLAIVRDLKSLRKH